MHTYNPAILNKLITKLKPYIVEGSLTIDSWVSFSGVHVAPAKIELDPKPKELLHLGDCWEATLDTTRYFEADVTIPKYLEDRKLYLNIDFGGESIIRINGKIAGSGSSSQCGGWVERSEILFHEKLKAGDVLHIQVENAINAGGYFDYQFPSGKPAKYIMEKAQIDVINEEAEDLWYDVKCAWDVYNNTEDEYVKKRIYNAVDSAVHKLDFDFSQEQFYKSIPSAKKLLWDEISKINYATPGDVLLCGHSHLDVAWLWTVKEIHRKCARTFSNNVSLMKAYPDFKFTQSQAAVYDFVKNDYPEIYEDVKKFVKNGQWEITGNTWVEADTNLASGESLIRQLLVGRSFFMKEFGVSSDTYWLPDCFGFTAALPQVIKKSGMKYFITSKLQYNDTNEFPCSVFKWRAHSGDEVLAYMQKVHYQGDADAKYIVDTRRTNRQNDLVDTSMGMFGYGDGGGGCTLQMIENVRRFQKLPGIPKVKMGITHDFFESAEKAIDELPTWDGEMYYENHRGTFTSQAFVKKNNRKGEFALRKAEMLSLLADTYDSDKLLELWKLLLVNQFHDILPGTSIKEVYDNTRKEYSLLNSQTKAYTEAALDKLNKTFAVGEKSIIVWNFIAMKNTALVSVEGDFENYGVKDAHGNIMKSSYRNGKLEFIAENVPQMGYKVFYLCENEAQESVTADATHLENKYIKATFNKDGLLISLIDKKSNKEILSGPSNRLSISHDKPDHESAWNLENDYQMKMWYLDKADKFELVEKTPAKAVLRTVHTFNKSTITQDIILSAEAKTLIFDTTVDWQETEKILKAEFQTDTRSRFATYEIAHGAIERPTYANNSYEKAMFECCAHKWADLSDGGKGLSVINDCKYGYDINKNVLRITLMRAPNLPDVTADKGINTFRYGCYIHEDIWSNADTVFEAEKENIPMTAHYVENGNGKLSEKSFITLSRNNIMIDAIKKAENGNGIILRFNEVGNKEDKVTVDLSLLESFSVNECNLMEAEDEKPQKAKGSFSFTIKPYEVKTFRITF